MVSLAGPAAAANESPAAKTEAAKSRLAAASAAYTLGHFSEAYDAYADVLKNYGDAIKKTDRTAAEAKLKELTTKTGTIAIHVNENGARVSLDEKDVGLSPTALPFRNDLGLHHVHVEKEGFSPFDSNVTVTAAGRAVVEVALTKKAKTGHVTVTAPPGDVMRVLVDGIDVGGTPYDGDFAPGSHTVAGRSSKSTAPVQPIDLVAGNTVTVSLAPSASTGRVEVTTSDGQGFIIVDGKPVAEGAFAGELPVGPHIIRVKREGYETFEKKVDLQEHETLAESVTLRASAGGTTKGADSKADSDRPFSGVYGGLGITALIEPNGNGNSLESSCSQIGAASCSTPPPLGVGLFGYGGYSWNPIGLELFLGAMFDEETPSANYTANSALGSVVGGPPRVEQFILPRLGGVAAIRARATLDGKVFRVSFSAGPGLAYKEMFLVRKATTQDGTNRQGKEVSDSVSYVSPALVADVAVHLRLSPGFALSGGVLALFENAGTTHVDAQNQVIASSTGGAPLRTFSYDTATGAQFFIGPYLGVEFGP
ncbi:MAG: PEGA domain-containing protein [Polyangiaceae bacterium]